MMTKLNTARHDSETARHLVSSSCACTLPYPNLPSKHASATTSSPSPLYCTLCLTSRLVRARPKGNLTTLARRHHSIHVGALLMRPLSLATAASDGSASEGRLREWQLVVAAAAAFAAFAFAFASAAAATLCVQRRVVPDLERFSVLDPFWGCECRTWENTHNHKHRGSTRKQIHANIAAVQWREQRPRKYPCQALPACRPGASPGSSRGPPPPAEALRAARRVGSVHASARGGG
jgi:hypothetical protein